MTRGLTEEGAWHRPHTREEEIGSSTLSWERDIEVDGLNGCKLVDAIEGLLLGPLLRGGSLVAALIATVDDVE